MKIETKAKNLMIAIIGVLAFFILLWIIPYSKKSSGSVNYSPDGFSKTIETPIKGLVLETKQQGLFWVKFDNNLSLSFSYETSKIPKEAGSTHPINFIQPGDSIIKNARTDTFYLVRDHRRWQYFLPK